eukprot:CAMPEP_0203661788 /NCGR_PEP_ID=MMETSP0088-20131115/59787_1 /ASSEMBLY_ACC=CAM_ASM_001087 /TAXON_ID=426623 /ORGANISM="Chaetoceros affinis, Strain CCMP159" /LENGTH=774 /DNA_ID=CAMNT_0050524481 /DNA_START=1 /DNA_END=2326 /DNA_ORIENTATION=+
MILAALLGLSTAEARKTSNLRKLQGNSDRKMKAPCTLVLRLEQFEDHSDAYEWDCELDPSDGAGVVSFPDTKFKKDEFESGASTLFGDVTIDKNGKATIKGNPVFGRREKNNNSRNLAVLGDRSVLAIRVVGLDIATTASETVISEEIFGTTGADQFNLKTGYTQCSNGDLNFLPTPDEPARSITNGVYTVFLNENISGLKNSELQTKVVNQATADLGTLNTQFDHVMLCLPPIAGFGGIAYAYVNWYLSVYKDAWCNYPSAQLHEIGHNIGLAHSNEGTTTYADQTGMMGYSYSSDEGPRQCFNNAKNWQLGWYADRRATATPLTASWDGDLVGFAEVNSIPATSDQVILLKVEGDDVDYYVGFNRKVGINSGTQEAGNQVTIQSRPLGTGYAESILVAKLSAGGTYVISDFAGELVTIEVLSINTASTPGVASVRVYKDSEPTKAPTQSPTKAPTQSPTKSPTQSPTEAPTKSPTQSPTESPTTKAPTQSPTKSPTQSPTEAPTKSPTQSPTESPTQSPTETPTKAPTQSPTEAPTKAPITSGPTKAPTKSPTGSPTQSPTNAPTKAPITSGPTKVPTRSPTKSPTQSPTEAPTKAPVTSAPTESPTKSPTESPTESPTGAPTVSPTASPTKPPVNPTKSPTKAPVTPNPTKSPTTGPNCSSIAKPQKCRKITSAPTKSPTQSPTEAPTISPTKAPTKAPVNPTKSPTKAPVTPNPTKSPTTGPECSSIVKPQNVGKLMAAFGKPEIVNKDLNHVPCILLRSRVERMGVNGH